MTVDVTDILSGIPDPDAPRPVSGLVDWVELWNEERGDDWLVEPVLAKGRTTAIYARQKAGKSFVALEMVVALVTGSALWERPAAETVSVLYLDAEMTSDDLVERLSDMGHAGAIFPKLAYYLLPDLPPLDTEAGAAALELLIIEHQAEVVIIDTMTSLVAGDENAADTFRAFHRHTGMMLKRHGVTTLRLDHAGKTAESGQRGSSAKADDPDVVFELSKDGDRVLLRATHRRVGWVPDRVRLTKVELPYVHHRLDRDGFIAGTAEVVELLDRLNVPVDASTREAMDALRAAGEGRRRACVVSARRARIEREGQVR